MAREWLSADAGDGITPPQCVWITGKVTVGGWINFRSLPGANEFRCIESMDSASPGIGINRWLGVHQTGAGVHQVHFTFQVGLGVQAYHFDHSMNTDEWHHILLYADAATDPDTVKIYLDGTSQSLNETGGFTNSAPGTTTIPTAPRLGRRASATFPDFNDIRMAHMFCSLDEWADEEIAALAKGYSPRMFTRHHIFNYPFSGGLEAWYYPLIGRNDPETGPLSPQTATNSGTTHYPHPRMMGWS